MAGTQVWPVGANSTATISRVFSSISGSPTAKLTVN